MSRYISNIPLEEIEDAIVWSFSMRQVFHRLGIFAYGGNNVVLMKQIIRENEFDISHFRRKPRGKHIISVRKRLMEERPYICVLCGQEPFHNGQSLTLQLDHKDGDKTNNSDENLRFLCPNCHTQTPTYGAGNRKSNGEVTL